MGIVRAARAATPSRCGSAPRVLAACGLTAALVLTGCTSGDDEPLVDLRGSGTPNPIQSPLTSPPSSGPASSSAPAATGGGPAGGTADHPAVLDAATRLLDWQPVADTSIDDVVTDNGIWTVTVDQAGSQARLVGEDEITVKPPSGMTIQEALLDEAWAVVVAADENGVRPAVATVVELATGRRTMIDGRSGVPTAPSGAWALGGDTLLRATYQGRDYCVASTDLTTSTTTVTYCAKPRHGFNALAVSAAGRSLLTFDAGQPSCRTPARLADDGAEPLLDVTPCKGSDSVLTEHGAVWGVVEKEQRYEVSHYYASYDDQYFDLGVGTTGTLTWCGDSAYFVRDTQKDVDKARLLRWTPDGALEVVYESPGEGNAFLTAPRCGGHVLTLTELGEGGDEQVSAAVP